MAKNLILVIDDEENIRNGLSLALKGEGYDVQTAANGNDGLKKLKLFQPDAVISDVRMPDCDGTEFLIEAKKMFPQIPVIMLTGHAGLNDAIHMMKIGAYDFLTKPVHLDKLFMTLSHVITSSAAIQIESSEEVLENLEQTKISFHSEVMLNLQHKIDQISPTDATVLLLGESGVGKEVFASEIHEKSRRSSGPFIKVHCAALPETLLESELFGHEKGAFTGANARRLGRFERAHGGTIFLDEIGDISAAVQVKLLRVLQEKEFERVGGEETIKTDVRIIAATNKNLEEAIRIGQFREDLFYRLSVLEIVIPPLRERKEDIPILADIFIQRFSKQYNKPKMILSSEVLDIFMRYEWRGNVRELQNAIETAIILSSGSVILKESLPDRLLYI